MAQSRWKVWLCGQAELPLEPCRVDVGCGEPHLLPSSGGRVCQDNSNAQHRGSTFTHSMSEFVGSSAIMVTKGKMRLLQGNLAKVVEEVRVNLRQDSGLPRMRRGLTPARFLPSFVPTSAASPWPSSILLCSSAAACLQHAACPPHSPDGSDFPPAF